MKIFIIIIVFTYSGCIDYMKLENENLIKEFDTPPTIDINHISPHPSRLLNAISIGKDCEGQAFKVPPIEDLNKSEKLYYIWFLDNQLASFQNEIAPENRLSAIIVLTIDEQFLLTHFNGKFPKDFFSRPHVLEFFVSDVPYAIPETRYIEDSKSAEKKHVDYAYWIIMFNQESC